MKVDVLESFKTQIKANKAIVEKSEQKASSNDYFNDGSTFYHDSREYNEIAMFQRGFDTAPSYILITAGA